MKKQFTLCDFCGKNISTGSGITSVDDRNQTRVVSMTYERFHLGTFKINDICKECNNKIMLFLFAENMLNGEKQ